jgi:catechol 2,3-dioxygenase-like lactoylglutathione lyase family enzyme
MARGESTIVARGREILRPEVIMAIIGAHVLLYTPEPEALRATLRDVFGWSHVDAGDGWLIFALPPAELGVHPAEGPSYEAGTRHQLSLMCDDIGSTVRELRSKGLEVEGEPEDEGWGITTTIVLPGGVQVLLYEPRHPVAISATGPV